MKQEIEDYERVKNGAIILHLRFCKLLYRYLLPTSLCSLVLSSFTEIIKKLRTSIFISFYLLLSAKCCQDYLYSNLLTNTLLRMFYFYQKRLLHVVLICCGIFLNQSDTSAQKYYYDYSGFESGYDTWNTGGVDAYRNYDTSNSDKSLYGDYNVAIQDNSGHQSSLYSDPYQLSGYDYANVTYDYYPQSMETGEKFYLEYSPDGGKNYNVLQEYESGTDFYNNNAYTANYTYYPDKNTQQLTDESVFRFRNDASSNYDYVYLDNIKVEAFTGSVTDYTNNYAKSVDCPSLDANFGDSCNDGNSNTINDYVDYSCNCVGTQVTTTSCSPPTYTYNHSNVSCNSNGSVQVYPSGGLSSYYFAMAGKQWEGPYSYYDFYNLGEGSWTFYISSDPYNSSCQTSLTLQIVDNCVTQFDCPSQGANFGDSCNDGNANTINDYIDYSCNCVGTYVPQYDCTAISANFGDSCNDGNLNTVNDYINFNCQCVGTFVPQYDCPAINANIGDACNDGNPNTTGDYVNSNCKCEGTVVTPPSGNTDCYDNLFNYHSFESSWGDWTDGGSDCYRSYDPSLWSSLVEQFDPFGIFSKFDKGGAGNNYSIRLRDNSGTASSVISSVFDFAHTDKAGFEFMFLGESMEYGEDFLLEYSLDGGNSWDYGQSWTSGVDFQNGVQSFAQVFLDKKAFTSNTVFRFRCDASSNYDKIYIDDINVYACDKNQVPSNPTPDPDPEPSCDAAAGTLTQVGTASVCLTDGSAEIAAQDAGGSSIPFGFSQVFVLTSGSGLVIEDVGEFPMFEVDAEGVFTIHSLVFDDTTLDLDGVDLGVTSAVDVLGLLVQGGGSICASLDVAGASFTISDCTTTTPPVTNPPTGGSDCDKDLADYQSFESLLGIWNDGGSDCYRSFEPNLWGSYLDFLDPFNLFSKFDKKGVNNDYCIRLRDNSGNASSLVTNALALAHTDIAAFEFAFLGESMENGENFLLEYSLDGGNNWDLGHKWTSGIDFVNGTQILERVVLDKVPFTDNTKFRFRCDASSNYDKIYLDDINIFACGGFKITADDISVGSVSSNQPIYAVNHLGSNILSENTEVEVSSEIVLDEIKIYPNPAIESINITGLNGRSYSVFNTSGQIVVTMNIDNKIDLSQFISGTYILRTEDGQVSRFIKL